jgi:DNA polymerase I-like protein with 3'-5' exonuclease and polymerase domains
MKVLFYEVLGLKPQRNHKTGQQTVDDTALVKLHELYPQFGIVFELIREMRSCGVFYNTFIRARVDPDKRMRCQFKPDGTETYRWASSKNAFGGGGNLQNIPSGHEEELASLVNP